MDADRDYMIRRYEWRGTFKADKGYMTHDVVHASNQTGLWVPMQTRRIYVLLESKNLRNDDKYEVEDFRRNSVVEKDVKVDFPVGTEVVDTVRKQTYVVED